jgi:hypothetical protein
MRPFLALWAALLSTASAHALSQPEWPTGPAAKMPKAEYVLQGDTKLEYDSLAFADGTIITTEGHELDLHIRQSLTINGRLLIRAFSPSDVPPKPSLVAKAAKGTSHDPGPETEGPAVASNGADGGTGARGNTGNPGLPGGRRRGDYLELRCECTSERQLGRAKQGRQRGPGRRWRRRWRRRGWATGRPGGGRAR